MPLEPEFVSQRAFELGADLQPSWYPSPNFGLRKEGVEPDLVVLHYTAMTSTLGALGVLSDPTCEVSAHYVIGEDGTVFQLVSENKRAWHAGAGRWGDVTDVNSRSIGIELSNDGFSPFPNALMESLEQLLRDIMARWDIQPAGVIGHSDLAPGRKIDPGRRFDWTRLARQGLALEVQPHPPCDKAQFRALGARAGYSAEISDEAFLAAFRLRHRPWGTGPLCDADLQIMAGLISALGLAPETANA